MVRKLCTVDEIRVAERAAIAAGRDESDLMLDAGRQTGDLIVRLSSVSIGHAVFLVGPGNNGGDGFVAAARLVEHGWTCDIWAFARDGVVNAPVSADVAEHFRWLTDSDSLREALASADVVVDAVFGAGGRAELPEPVAAAFEMSWQSRLLQGVPLVALDVPSGIDADTGEADDQAFRADHTAMIGLPKIGLYRSPADRHTGIIHELDIGLPQPEPQPNVPAVITAEDVRQWLPRRNADTHKHEVGWLLVIGGAPGYVGAPRLAAEAAARAGVGLVGLAVPRSLVGSISAGLPEAIFVPLPEAEFGGAGARMAEIVRDVMDQYRALLIGPGLGQEPPVDDFLANLLGTRGTAKSIGFGVSQPEAQVHHFDGRAVFDADGLNWLASHPGWQKHLSNADLVLTPHPGELSRLLDKDVAEITADPWAAAQEAARLFDQVVVLKFAHPVVASPDGTLLLGPQILPALATAGSGDVLAGITGGLVAQGMPSKDAAAAGVFIGTEAAQLATREVGTLGLVSSDLLSALPYAVQQLYDAIW